MSVNQISDSIKPRIILATSNGVGMGHLARASAVAQFLRESADVYIVSMAAAVADVGQSLGIPVEYIPGRDRGLMPAIKWDDYLRDRLVALIDELDAKLICFDGVVPYPGVIAARSLRPKTKLVWMRRGFWQERPQKHLLALQSRLMDHIIEPGDYASEYDLGPTSRRNDATRIGPISLYSKNNAFSRLRARKILGLAPNRPAVLVQMGTGDLDFDSKLTAALRGLTGWSGLQVVMTKVPIGLNGESLVPEGLDIKIIRYFPLADVLHAFDGAIAAAGYNSVHELLPARIPTVFIPNDRGTDNQRDRAKWTEDRGFAYFADAGNLDDITRVVKRLRDASKRALLIDSCGQLSLPAGAQQASRHLLEIASAQDSTSVVNVGFKGKYLFYLIRTQFSRRIRFLSYSLLRHISLCYRKFVPRHGAVEVVESEGLPVFSQSQIAKEMHPLIKSNGRYEHLIPNASPSYICRRREIAEQAFGVDVVGDLDMASEETKALILENSTR